MIRYMAKLPAWNGSVAEIGTLPTVLYQKQGSVADWRRAWLRRKIEHANHLTLVAVELFQHERHGPAVWPAKANIQTNIYISEELYYIDYFVKFPCFCCKVRLFSTKVIRRVSRIMLLRWERMDWIKWIHLGEPRNLKPTPDFSYFISKKFIRFHIKNCIKFCIGHW